MDTKLCFVVVKHCQKTISMFERKWVSSESELFSSDSLQEMFFLAVNQIPVFQCIYV